MNFLFMMLLILILSYSITMVLDYKALESIFISVCSIIVLTMVLVLFMELSQIVTLFYVLIGLFFAVSLYLALRNKQLARKTKEYFNSPALTILVLITIVFSRVIKGAMPVGYDDLGLWAYLPKVILSSDGLFMPEGVAVYSQMYGLPIYYALVSKIAGHSFDVMLCAKWFLVWTCLLLPFVHHTFRKSFVVAIYFIVVYGIVLSIPHSTIELYSDVVLYSMFAGIIGYLFINRDVKARNIVLLCYMMLMPLIKNTFGLMSAAFVLVLYIFDQLYINKGKLIKQSILLMILSIGAMVYSIVYTSILPKLAVSSFDKYEAMNYLYNYKGLAGGNVCNYVDSIINTIKSPVGLLLVGISFVSAVIMIILFCKENKKSYIFLAPILISIVYLAITIYRKFDNDSVRIISIISKYINKFEFIHMNFVTIVAIVMVAAAAYYLFYFNRKQKRYFVMLSVFFLAFCMVIFILITMNLSLRADFVNYQYTAGLDRYVGLNVYLFLFLIPMYFFGRTELFKSKNVKNKIFSVILILILIIVFIQPARQSINVYNDKVSNFEKHVMNFYKYEELNTQIERYTGKDEDICIVIDAQDYKNRPNYIYVVLQYYTLLPRDRFVLLDKELNIEKQTNNLEEFIKANNITKIAYIGEDRELNDSFNMLFSDKSMIAANNIYTVIWDNEELKFDICN